MTKKIYAKKKEQAKAKRYISTFFFIKRNFNDTSTTLYDNN